MYTIATNDKIKKRFSVTTSKTGGGKFCKICKDSGKSMDEYTSHYVRATPNPNSVIVCPTLIASICRYCKEGGHTVKHCPKIQIKNQLVTKPNHVVSNYQCSPVNDNTNNLGAFAVFDDDDDDEEDLLKTPSPTTKGVISYASVLKKTPPSRNNIYSQVDSLIPIKLDFNYDNHDIVTLDNITKRWSDDEDIEDCIILTMINTPPDSFVRSHPLVNFVSFVDILVKEYTSNFTKSIYITSDAFHQLSKNWETTFFELNGGKEKFDDSKNTNVRSRNDIMTSRYTIPM